MMGFLLAIVVAVFAAGSFMSLAVLSASLVERIIWVACECFSNTPLAALLYVSCGRVCFEKMLATWTWLHLLGLALGMAPPLNVQLEEPSSPTSNVPVETTDVLCVSALAASYVARRSFTRPMPLSAVKSNLGHGETTAGVTSVLKVVLQCPRQ